MSDDLLKRLRKKRVRCHDLSGVYWIEDMDCQEAADRIEELKANGLANRVAIMRLEAKLAKAVETLQTIDDVIDARSELFTSDRDLRDNVQDRIRVAIAELTGGEDG